MKTLQQIFFLMFFAGFFSADVNAITIAIGGNEETMLLQMDQVTTDLCTHINDCGQAHMLSLQGKAGQVTAGTLDNSLLKSQYAPSSTDGNHANYTEHSPWSENGSPGTQINSAFTATTLVSPIAQNGSASPTAMGGNTASGADQALSISQLTDTLGVLNYSLYWGLATNAGSVTYAGNAGTYLGAIIAGVTAANAQSWVK